jgi:hypothetical protein
MKNLREVCLAVFDSRNKKVKFMNALFKGILVFNYIAMKVKDNDLENA